MTLTADRAVVDTQSPISLLPGTVVTVNGKKCVLDVSHGTGKLVAYPIKSGSMSGVNKLHEISVFSSVYFADNNNEITTEMLCV